LVWLRRLLELGYNSRESAAIFCDGYALSLAALRFSEAPVSFRRVIDRRAKRKICRREQPYV
jgi:hypothetical protein